jgi:trans-2,3-dihydro-3-hydroxyanthranilate isomerase
MDLEYLLLDVFTTERMKGNQLAVVCNADGLLDNEMQTIAEEFNLSETIFLTKPSVERNHASVRIFTPRHELPFAGHPTVGASVVIGLRRDVPVVRLEEKVGVITALFEATGKHSGRARFTLPRLPDEAALGHMPDTATIAMTLGVLPEEIGCGLYKPGIFTAGNPFYMIPVRNARVLANLKLERRGWAEVFPYERHAVYVFTETPEEDGVDFAARMFAPGMPGGEDPGTGSAAAALIGLIARHVPFADGQGEYVLRQGDEMGRPCRIALQLRKDADILTHAGIGGDALIIGEGKLLSGG